MSNISIYSIECLTNMHPGGGEGSNPVIDKMVQRDATTGLPYINSSSIKGAIREYITKGDDRLLKNQIQDLFGKEPKENEISKMPGSLRFFDASIVFYPDPETEPQTNTQFTLKSTEEVWTSFNSTFVHFGLSEDQLKESKNLLTKGSKLESYEDFKIALNNFNLPVNARNQLENGESQNLWYEQFIPRRSIFLTAIMAGPDTNPEYLKEFEKSIQSKPLQIGANASIGMGFCMVRKINL